MDRQPDAMSVVAIEIGMNRAKRLRLGGRPVTRDSLRRVLTSAERGELPAFSFLDLDTHLVEGELTRIRAARRSGPTAENILRDLAGRS